MFPVTATGFKFLEMFLRREAGYDTALLSFLYG